MPVLFRDALTCLFEYISDLRGSIDLPSHIEVAETHLTQVCDKQIAWFQVSVNDAILVQEA